MLTAKEDPMCLDPNVLQPSMWLSESIGVWTHAEFQCGSTRERSPRH